MASSKGDAADVGDGTVTQGWCDWAAGLGGPALTQDSLELLLWHCDAAGFMGVGSHSLGVNSRWLY